MNGTPKDDGPQPPEAFGIAELTEEQVTRQKSGHDPSLSRAQAGEGGVLPPHNLEDIPQTSLAERIRQGRTGKEGAK